MKPLYFILLAILATFWPPVTKNVKKATCITGSLASRKILQNKAYQIVISEIMADPTPCVSLPDAEYFELYNRSTQTADLSGYSLIIGSRSKTIVSGTIEPLSYVILCDAENSASFSPYGNTLPVDGFPAILNSGTTITLEDPFGTVIHSVSFSDEWYDSAEKKSGGWSLEIIDPDNPCGGSGNWKETTDNRGGTPGTANSVKAKNPDLDNPSVLHAYPVDESTVRLYFSENMEMVSLTDPHQYSVNNGLYHPFHTEPVAPDYKSVNLAFSGKFNNGIQYALATTHSLCDCAGNPLSNNMLIRFSLPQAADSFDITFNEILFDARDDQDEFIELYNRSSKAIDLASFSMALLDPVDKTIKKEISFREHHHLVLPDGYLVIASDVTKLSEITKNTYPGNVEEIPDFFTLPDKEGYLVLYDTLLHCIDQVYYASNMHNNLLNITEGVSLEKVEGNQVSLDRFNWQSASETSGFSTPGYKNSQHLSSDPVDQCVAIDPPVFSPDQDGFDDVVHISLTIQKPGSYVNIMIFNASGQPVKTLASNLLIGSENHLTWDGRNNSGKIASIGIYLIYIELLNANGTRNTYKKAVTLLKKTH